MQGTAEAATGPGEVPEQYVINLCASTTPMALEQPKDGALKRFSFFISRRREDGRERFRLHMGYFASPDEAQEWLAVVRELYPAAWVGEAPGKKLRAAARAAALEAKGGTAPVATSAAAPVAAPVATPAQVAALLVPEPVPVPVVAPIQVPTLPAAASAAPVAAVESPAPLAVAAPPAPAAPAAPVAARTDAPVSGTPAAVAALSNVREVLAQLDEPQQASDAPGPIPAPVPAPTPAAPPRSAPQATPAHTLYVPPPPVLPEHIPTVRALTPAPMSPPPSLPAAKAPARAAPVAPAQKAPATTQAMAKPAAASPTPLSDTQVLRVLEERRADGAKPAGPATAEERAANTAIEMLRPEDTRTMRALKEDVQRDAPAQFAVQLAWSVTPIDASAVPPLAIFSAYTLYSVETNREGRRWYGLRLGFFTDALSAKQVAYYVRSDFSSVAVVPVTAAEKENAVAGARLQPAARKAAQSKAADEFKLFDADQPPTKPAPPAEAVRARIAEAAKAGKRPAASRAKPAQRKKAQSLEESLEQTLEILGAGHLEIDRGRGELLNDTGVRHLSVKVDKRTSTFAKLLDRLSDRVGKG